MSRVRAPSIALLIMWRTMGVLTALLLGLVQGLTEFFPVSSSAHLAFVKELLGLGSCEKDVVFDLSCHLGTLLALLIFLRKDIWHIFTKDRKKIAYIFIALLPLIPFYFFLKPLRDFASQPQFLGGFLMLTGCMLWIANRACPKENSPSYTTRNLMWIGAVQAVALIPGISRSGSTISTARLLGWPKCKAVRFSFLLSIPAICGGTFLEILKVAHTPLSAAPSLYLYMIGFTASFAVGLSIVSFALRFLEKGNLKPFAYYSFCIGILITLYYIVV